MRRSWVLVKSRALVSGVKNIGVCAAFNKVELPDLSRILKALVKLGDSEIVSKDFFASICISLLTLFFTLKLMLPGCD